MASVYGWLHNPILEASDQSGWRLACKFDCDLVTLMLKHIRCGCWTGSLRDLLL